MFNKVPIEGKNVVCIVSGGNIDVNILDRVIKRGLLTAGRTALLKIELMDRPGQLVQVSQIIAEHGGNITGVHHERTNENTGINGCFVRINIETRNFEHINTIKQALKAKDFKIWE
jgi:threonine dehydratase